MSAPPGNKAFDNAFKRFLDSLPESQRQRYSPCSSSQDLLEGLGKLKSISKKHETIRFNRVVNSIQTFNTRLRPYFESIGCMIQSNPEIAAIVWGSLRLVLQLVDNFSGFFDKTIQCLSEISGALPQYDDIAALFNRPLSSRLNQHLEAVYENIFAFFQIIAEVFSKPDGRLKRRTAVAWDLMWTPVDVRFKGLLGTLRCHQQLIRDELSISKAKAADNAATAAEHERGLAAEERRRAEMDRSISAQMLRHTDEIKALLTEDQKVMRFDKICKWLGAPKNYTDALETSMNLKEEGTCAWIQNTTSFQNWLNMGFPIQKPPNKLCPNVFWVYGSPGAGKTVLASSIICELQETMSSCSNVSVCYYFFQAEVGNDKNITTSAAYGSILTQILYQNRENERIVDKFAFCMMNNSQQRSATQKNLIGLLQLCAQELSRTYIVLDGVDECSDKDGLLNTIANVSTFGPISILLLSRPSILGLYQKTTSEQRLQITRTAVGDDIKTYLASNIASLIEEQVLPDVPLQELIEPLLSGADGMFLWAKLMIKLLRSPVLTPSRRYHMISEISLPEGLDKVYNRILSLVSESGSLERETAKHVFCWLAFAKTPVTVRLLYEAVHKCQLDLTATIEDDVQRFREMLSVVCGALVEISSPVIDTSDSERFDVYHSLNLNVKFVHLSVREHFTKVHPAHDTLGAGILMEHALANVTLAREALTALSNADPKAPSPGENLSKYSAFFWTKHLSDSVNREIFEQLPDPGQFRNVLRDLLQLLSKFLDTPLLVTRWIFWYYQYGGGHLYGPLPYEDFGVWLQWLRDPTDPTESLRIAHKSLQTYGDFTHDMARLVRQWDSKLQDTPEILWDEAVSFLGSRFLVDCTLTKVTSLTSSGPTDALQSSRPLGDISLASSNGQLNFRLSVWPSKTFEQRWLTLGANDTAARVRDACSGWTMRYEVWSIQSKSCVGQIEIPLDEHEIWFAMRQLLYEEGGSNWKTAFPMAISSSGRFVAMLRTVFLLQLSGDTVSYDKTVLNIDYTDAHRKQWDENLGYFDPQDPFFANNPVLRRGYIYSITFSSCEQYLLYSDSRYSGISHHYAVHSIAQSPKLQLDKINYISETQLGLLVRPLQPEFHGSAELILVCDKPHVYVWAFRDPLTTMKLDFPDYGQIQEMKVSECGKFVVVVFACNKTIVLELPPEALVHRTSLISKNREFLPAESSSESSLASLGATDISAFGIRKGEIVTGRSCVMRYEQGIPDHMIHLQGGDRPSIQLTRQTGATTHSLELLSLPTIRGVGQLSSVALMPESEDEPLRVIVNTTSRTDYSMSDIDDTQFPALIERKVQFMTPQEDTMGGTQRSKIGAVPYFHEPSNLQFAIPSSSIIPEGASTAESVPPIWKILPDALLNPQESVKPTLKTNNHGIATVQDRPMWEVRPDTVEMPVPKGESPHPLGSTSYGVIWQDGLRSKRRRI